jgi:hypothetical protein
LRDLERPDGLGRKNLSKAEYEQLLKANQIFELSAEAVKYQLRKHRAFWLESSDDRNKADFWKTTWGTSVEKHALVEKAAFDQCMFGEEVPKPTKIAHFGLDLSQLKGIRCTHQNRTWLNADGSQYQAKHKWTNPPKALGVSLCRILAKAVLEIDQPRPKGLLDVRTEALP